MQDDEPDENIRQAEGAVRFIWRFLLMPLLFCLIGTTINFSTLASSTIAKACSIVFAGALIALRILFCDALRPCHNSHTHLSLKGPESFASHSPRSRVESSLQVSTALVHLRSFVRVQYVSAAQLDRVAQLR